MKPHSQEQIAVAHKASQIKREDVIPPEVRFHQEEECLFELAIRKFDKHLLSFTSESRREEVGGEDELICRYDAPQQMLKFLFLLGGSIAIVMMVKWKGSTHFSAVENMWDVVTNIKGEYE